MKGNDLFDSYEKTMNKTINKYFFSNIKKINSNDVMLDLLINNSYNIGKVRLIKLRKNKFFIIHVSSPSYVWDEELSIKILNSFQLQLTED